MKGPGKRSVKAIKFHARRIMVVARHAGLPVEWEELLSIGLEAFVRARLRYKTRDGVNQAFTTYLNTVLDNAYKNTLRTLRRKRRNFPEARSIQDEEGNRIYPIDAIAAVESSEEALLDLVLYHCSQLSNQIDKEVLVERVFPSKTTVMVARLEQMRREHLLKAGVVMRRVPTGKVILTTEVLARSLGYTVPSIRRAQTRIRSLLMREYNVKARGESKCQEVQ